MDRRYQVFISSTYDDLQAERAEIMKALLELDCIPSGMELFPAADEDQWSLIRRVIDDCDYYIVIVGGRYGSVGPSGLSFTEMEYDYAISRGKPTIGFIHKDVGAIPSSKSEQSTAGRESLDRFRKKVQQRLVKSWSNPEDLGSAVSRSIIKLMKDRPATGWVRGDSLASESASIELLRLRTKLDELQAELGQVRNNPPAGTENLAQADDLVSLNVEIHYEDYAEGDEWVARHEVSATWGDIFKAVAPVMIDEANEADLRRALMTFIREHHSRELHQSVNGEVQKFELPDAEYYKVVVQLRALGLITKSERRRSLKDQRAYWSLTPYGDTMMTRAVAVHRQS